nr:hypothetical protein [Pantoea agglomerans]
MIGLTINILHDLTAVASCQRDLAQLNDHYPQHNAANSEMPEWVHNVFPDVVIGVVKIKQK